MNPIIHCSTIYNSYNMEKAREFQKSIYFCFIDHAKVFVWITKKLLKILKEMGIQDHLTCLQRTL